MAVHAKVKNVGRGGSPAKPLRGGAGSGNLPGRQKASAGKGRRSFGRATPFQKLR